MTGPIRRRLAAILAAGVVGLSKLMGADEEGTLTRLKALFSTTNETGKRKARYLKVRFSCADWNEGVIGLDGVTCVPEPISFDGAEWRSLRGKRSGGVVE